MKYKKRDVKNAGAEKILFALVADYENRRKAAERAHRAAEHTDDKGAFEEIERFKKINQRIDECLEFIEPMLRDYIREDIGRRRGWERSQASSYVSKDAYFARKNQAIEKMLLAFRLILPPKISKKQ